MLILLPGGLLEGEATVIRGSASADVNPGGAAATSALSLRSSSVHNTAAMGLEFICCLNLKHEKKKSFQQILTLATLLSDIKILLQANQSAWLHSNYLCFSLITLHSGRLQMQLKYINT